jgi:pyridoxamine 5'-phosphate oxidase-like protein
VPERPKVVQTRIVRVGEPRSTLIARCSIGHGEGGGTMDQQQDVGAVARDIIDSTLYMVLGTADESGRPWASPVYYAVTGYREFYWVSSPGATHSRNIAVRPQVSLVVFNSQVPIGTGQGVYMPAMAEEVTDADLGRGIGAFSRRSLVHGGSAWTADDVRGRSPLRLFRATASEHSVLAKDGRPDHRIVVDLTADAPGGS